MLGVLRDMGIRISLCGFSEVEQLMSFIDSDWKKDHIFVRDRKLFDWQHKGKDNYNFVLAKNEDDIVGVLGYIPLSQYSSILAENNELWLAIWKVKDGISKPGLGLMMLKFLNKKYNNPSICSIGLSKQVIPIYKAFKYKVGVLSHLAFFNNGLDNFKICTPDINNQKDFKSNDLTYRVCDNVAFIDESFFLKNPRKNHEYIINRYVNHPRYKYNFLLIYIGELLLSVSVFREINIDGSKVSRIVDGFGENITNSMFNYNISQFLKEFNYEYMDLVSNINHMPGSGFVSSSESIIIPNYFEPFEKRNVQIDYAYKSTNDLVIYRGDSDQDRPNL
jgi:hypothetical protein